MYISQTVWIDFETAAYDYREYERSLTKKCLTELTTWETVGQFPQTFLTNPLKLRIDRCKIPTCHYRNFPTACQVNLKYFFRNLVWTNESFVF